MDQGQKSGKFGQNNSDDESDEFYDRTTKPKVKSFEKVENVAETYESLRTQITQLSNELRGLTEQFNNIEKSMQEDD